MVESIIHSLPLDRYKKGAIPVRIFFIAVICVEFFKLHSYLGIDSIPLWILVPVFSLTTIHLMTLAYERSLLVTTEIVARKCPICKRQMYSKIIKCENCKIQIDTDEEK